MRYAYLSIIFIIIALTISFRNYKKEEFHNFSFKDAPLKFLYGFSMIFIIKHLSKEDLKGRLHVISICILSFTLLMFTGFIYCIVDTTPGKTAKITDDHKISSSLEVKESHDANNLNESNGTCEDSSTQTPEDTYDYVKDTISIFEKYREGIENSFLGENESFFAITKPLNLISSYGEEGVTIFWEFGTEDVIDTNGNIIYENISSDGCSTVAYATLSLNGTCAVLTIPICISPP